MTSVGIGVTLGGSTSSPSTSTSTSTPSTSTSTPSSPQTTPTVPAGAGSNVYVLITGYLGAGPMQMQGFYASMSDAQAAAPPIIALYGLGAIWRVLSLPVVAQSVQ